MNLLARIGYIFSVLLWTSYELSFPFWVGRFYNAFDTSDSTTWYSGGVFGLRGLDGFYVRAPVWDPPAAHSELIHPIVRWPWDLPTQHEHVELACAHLLNHWSIGIFVMGLVVRGIFWLMPLKRPDITLSVAWSTSLFLVLAWLCIFALAIFSMGYAATDNVVIAVLSIGLLSGVLYGISVYLLNLRMRVTKADGAESSSSPGIVPGSQEVATKKVRQVGGELMWVTLGVSAGFGIMLAVGFVASILRNYTQDVTALGPTPFARPNASINIMSGLSIIAIGWLLASLLVRLNYSRGLAYGLLISSTGLGILFAIWH